ncbi:hypothetical protein AMTRI_Chr04g253680 [Amborella trichopoda]
MNEFGINKSFNTLLNAMIQTKRLYLVNYMYCIGIEGNLVYFQFDMEDNWVLPNDVTYDVVIKSYHKEGRPREALSLLNEMLKKKFIPCPTPCCKFFYLICQEGKVDEACMLWKKLLKLLKR